MKRYRSMHSIVKGHRIIKDVKDSRYAIENDFLHKSGRYPLNLYELARFALLGKVV